MEAANRKALCWVLSDGRPGMENQCLGLARALGLEPVIKRLSLRAPWGWLPPALQVSPLSGLSRNSDPLRPPWPEVLIATGRRSAAIAAAIRDRAKGRCFAIQIQNPNLDPRRFDAVVAPRHDGLVGDNVIATLGAMGQITPQKLTKAGEEAPESLLALPKPRVALLVGGPNSAFGMPAEHMRQRLGAVVRAVTAEGGGLMASASNRTPGAVKQLLAELPGKLPATVWRGPEDGPNPYFAMLALADAFLVTADSVNMVCEAAASGKPVLLLDLPGGSEKFHRFHQSLREACILRDFNGRIENWSYRPLAETRRVAELLSGRLAAHLSTARPSDVASRERGV
jgi:mitochondrial fission protein ELM1